MRSPTRAETEVRGWDEFDDVDWEPASTIHQVHRLPTPNWPVLGGLTATCFLCEPDRKCSLCQNDER